MELQGHCFQKYTKILAGFLSHATIRISCTTEFQVRVSLHITLIYVKNSVLRRFITDYFNFRMILIYCFLHQEYSESRKMRKLRKILIEIFDNFYFSPNVVTVIKSRILWWSGHIVRMGEESIVLNVSIGKCYRKDTFI